MRLHGNHINMGTDLQLTRTKNYERFAFGRKEVPEKPQYRDAETLTDEHLWRPPPVPWQQPALAGWYDQSAFVAAVTTAVQNITAKRADPQPILPQMLNAQNVVDSKSWARGCFSVSLVSTKCSDVLSSF